MLTKASAGHPAARAQDDARLAPLLAAIIEAESGKPGALLPILHSIQDALGYIPREAVPVIAKALNLSRAEVHGVVTFYSHFRTTPPGEHVIRLCQAEACQAMGALALAAHAQSSLGVNLHATTPDGAFTLEPVYCLGNCACSPAMMIDDDLHGRIDPQRFDAIVNGLRRSSGAPAASAAVPKAKRP